MSDSERDWLRQQQLALARTLTHPATIDSKPLVVDPLLSGMDAEELRRSSETLIRKRISQTASLLPISVKVLGPEFASQFRRFASTHFFSGHNAISREAIEFAGWIANQCNHPPWLHDCLAWESKRCLWESRRYYIAMFRLRYAVHQVLDRDRDIAPDVQPRHVLLWRLRSRGAIRIYRRW